ncbi:response regulator transcription factor [Chryseobacterium gambrini]|uniref:response regulator transcription factor n=1 Tax=Chryseobacterium gambrini TaxID=373672 RepID=UPI003D09DD15
MKILLFDDHTLFVQSFKILLESNFSAQHEVLACTDIEEVNDCMERQKIDLIFTDYLIPELDIFHIINKWKKENEFIKIVVLSSINSSNLIARLLLNNVDGFLSKSASQTEIGKCINYVNNNKKYVCKNFESDVMQYLLLKENNIFSQRELEIIELIKQGKSIKDKAKILSLSENTVITHRRNIMQKAGVKFVTELLAKLGDFGL